MGSKHWSQILCGVVVLFGFKIIVKEGRRTDNDRRNVMEARLVTFDECDIAANATAMRPDKKLNNKWGHIIAMGRLLGAMLR